MISILRRRGHFQFWNFEFEETSGGSTDSPLDPISIFALGEQLVRIENFQIYE